jgi:hypothetical protein
MKSFKFRTALLSLALLTTSFAAARGKEVGDGGDGYLDIDNILYVLDLVESGVYLKPYLSEDVEPLGFIRERVERALVMLPDAPVDLIARKITELYQINNILGFNLLYALEKYSWKLVPTLPDIDDEDTVLETDDNVLLERKRTLSELFFKKLDVGARLVQLAIRREHSIHVHAGRWQRELEEVNRAALVFHEIVFALSSPIEATIDGRTFKYQSSYSARAIVGLFFSPELRTRGEERIRTMASHLAPYWDRYLGFREIPNALTKNPANYLVPDTGEFKDFIYQAGYEDYLNVRVSPDMGYAQIHQLTYKHCDTIAARLYEGRVVYSIYPTARLDGPLIPPFFEAYTAQNGKRKISLRPIGVTQYARLLDVRAEREKSPEKFKEISVDSCTSLSMRYIEEVWRLLWTKPFPLSPEQEKALKKPAPKSTKGRKGLG